MFPNSTSCLYVSSRDALSTPLLKNRELVQGLGSAPLVWHRYRPQDSRGCEALSLAKPFKLMGAAPGLGRGSGS